MILVSKEDKPFTYTVKGAPRRKAVISAYETEIEELYRTVEDTALNGFTSPATWSLGASRIYVRAVVTGVMMTAVGDDDDFFAHGCDRFGRDPSSTLPLMLTQILSVSRQLGSKRLSLITCVRAPGSTLRISQTCLYTNIRPSICWGSLLPT